MAGRARLSMGDVLQQLDSDNSYDHGMAEGSDDDLGMSLDTDYDSDDGNVIH